MVCATLAAGCGGGGTGGRDAPEPLTGVLQAGGVHGVQYQTATRSGVTDANGSFRYLPGETVTFSIGAVTLGQAPGAAGITLFTLAGLTPPTTEWALRRELDRARRMSTPFTRAINIERLLMALDADWNPDNGLDVRGREAALANVSLDLDLPVREFAARLERKVPNLTRNVPLWKPAAQLYRGIGVMVPAHAPALIRQESDAALPPTSIYMTFDADGLLESEGFDNSGDGVAESRYRYTYDALGRTIAIVGERDSDFDGLIDDLQSVNYSFDASGIQLSAEQAFDANFDGVVDDRFFVEYAYDRFGNLRSGTARIDFDNDGVIDRLEMYEATADARNNTVSATVAYDDDADGIVDSRSHVEATYDAQDRLLALARSWDFRADGIFDSRDTETYEYNGAGLATRLVAESDYDLDGVVDSRAVYSWTHDGAGNQLTRVVEDDYDADGVVDQRQTSMLSYDADRRELSEVRDEDFNADDVFDIRTSASRTFDSAGNVLEYILEYEDDGLPGVDARYVERSEYGADGELLRSSFSGDADADGVTDFHTSTTVTHTLVNDGVPLLAQWYFSRN